MTTNLIDTDLQNIISLYKAASCLKDLPRQGFLLEGYPLRPSDSVACHSFCVAIASYLVAEALKARGFCIDTDKVLRIAVFHDLGESATGEIATGVKWWMNHNLESPGIVERMEHGLFGLLVSDVDTKGHLAELIAEYDASNTLEAKVVKFADVLEPFAEAKDRLGTTFPDYLTRSREKLRAAQDEDARKVGCLLEHWLEVIEIEWEGIPRKRPWAQAAKGS